MSILPLTSDFEANPLSDARGYWFAGESFWLNLTVVNSIIQHPTPFKTLHELKIVPGCLGTQIRSSRYFFWSNFHRIIASAFCYCFMLLAGSGQESQA